MTEEQEAMLRRCEHGVDIYSVSAEEFDTLEWLLEQGYCQFGNGCGVLSETRVFQSQNGKAYLAAKQQYVDEMAKKNTDDVRQKQSDRRFELVKILITVVATLTIEHLPELVAFIQRIISQLNKP